MLGKGLPLWHSCPMRQRTRFFLAASCAAALCLVTRANAQEVETTSWTGFYIGGNVGGLSSHYDFGAFTDTVDVDAQFAQLEFDGQKLFGPELNVAIPIDIDLDDFGFAEFSFPGAGPGFSTFNDGSDQSILGGGQIGYNKQFGHFVVGVEGDFQGTSAGKGQISSGFIGTDNLGLGDPIPGGLFTDEFGETTLTAERRAETCWTASLRARLGYAIGPILFYGTAGVAFTEVNVTAIETASTDFFEEPFLDDEVAAAARPVPNGANGINGNFIGNVTTTNLSKSSSDDVEIGWTGGVGTAWAINKTVSLGVEYRHSDYGSRTYQFVSNSDGVIIPGDTKVSLDTDQVTLRVNILISNFFGH